MKKDKRVKEKGIPKIGSQPGRKVNKTYKELKREAVIRGMPFPDVVESDVWRLIAFINNSNNKPNISLVDEFDKWADIQLEMAGYEKGSPLRSSNLRLGFIGEELDNGQVKVKRIKGIPKPRKEKKERDENNLYKGTKKSYAFELANRGFTLERVIRRVLKKFPDAKEKSIKIWFRQAVKKDEKGK